MSVLSGEDVAKYCKSLVKVNPNGVDLAPKEVSELPAHLTIYLHGPKRGYVDAAGRIKDAKRPIRPNRDGFYSFRGGRLYELRFDEVRVPADCTGFAFPRSSINRLGVIKLETAVFDSGYNGEPTQSIFTPINAMVHRDEAMVQLVFIRNERAASKLYDGFYQNEKGRGRRQH